MTKTKVLNKIRERRKKRTRAKIHGTAEKPRLSVFRSNRYTYVQLIDDEKGKTLVGASSREIKKSKIKSQESKVALAGQLGELIAKKAVEKGIGKAVFNRGNYKYHGRVKAVAEGARKEGLQL
ncbi:MAG: 50S ribosomal protein L18 [bacterium]|nr:50S ribosomal protein L18 [bacterium]